MIAALRKLKSITKKLAIAACLVAAVVLAGCQSASVTGHGGKTAEEVWADDQTTRTQEASEQDPAEDDAPLQTDVNPEESFPEEDSQAGELPEETREAASETTEDVQAETTLSEEQQELVDLPAGSVLTEEDVEEIGEDAFFSISEISDELFDRMYGKSFKEDCTVPREDLRYIRCLHKNYEGVTMIGEMVVNYRIAEDVLDIFRELYNASFPIEKMHLVDDYDASDDASMEDDNTSCFNFRLIAGTDTISNHAYGLAIDINPYYNVYYIPSADYVSPASAYEYKNRDAEFPYKVGPGDLCYELFMEHGFDWGGWWDYAKDYQHFEKPLSSFDE